MFKKLPRLEVTAMKFSDFKRVSESDRTVCNEFVDIPSSCPNELCYKKKLM